MSCINFVQRKDKSRESENWTPTGFGNFLDASFQWEREGGFDVCKNIKSNAGTQWCVVSLALDEIFG